MFSVSISASVYIFRGVVCRASFGIQLSRSYCLVERLGMMQGAVGSKVRHSYEYVACLQRKRKHPLLCCWVAPSAILQERVNSLLCSCMHREQKKSRREQSMHDIYSPNTDYRCTAKTCCNFCREHVLRLYHQDDVRTSFPGCLMIRVPALKSELLWFQKCTTGYWQEINWKPCLKYYRLVDPGSTSRGVNREECTAVEARERCITQIAKLSIDRSGELTAVLYLVPGT